MNLVALGRTLILALCAAPLLASCASAPSASPAAIAIENVTILSMLPDTAPQVGTVLIVGDRVEAVGAAVVIPRGARRIDGRGKWLTPGFTDMHVHVDNVPLYRLLTGDQSPFEEVPTEDVYLPYIAHGVTQVFNQGGNVENLTQRDEIARGEALGPHVFVAGMIDGSPPIWPIGYAYPAATPEEARARVREVQAAGFDFVKAYSMLTRDAFDAIIDESAAAGMRVVGHLPERNAGNTAHYLTDGMNLVSHAEEFAYQTPTLEEARARIPLYVDLARRNGVPIVATLTVDERIHEQMLDPSTLRTRPETASVHPLTHHWWVTTPLYANASPERIEGVRRTGDFNRHLVKAFADGGVTVFVGTDSLVPGVVPGSSLHDEMALLADAGLSNAQILQAATRAPSEWLGVGDDRGAIAPGQRADLVLLDADPLADITNTRAIAAVIVGGRVLLREELDAKMDELHARYAAFRAARAVAP